MAETLSIQATTKPDHLLGILICAIRRRLEGAGGVADRAFKTAAQGSGLTTMFTNPNFEVSLTAGASRPSLAKLLTALLYDKPDHGNGSG